MGNVKYVTLSLRSARGGMTCITLILARRESTEFKFLKRLMILSRPDCWMCMEMSYSA